MTAVIYTRYSPRPTAKSQDCVSIQTQASWCTRKCYDEEWGLDSVHIDENKTGATIRRPGLNAALARCSELKGVFVVYSLSRFARSVRHAIDVSEKLKTSGCQLVSVKDNIDTTTPVGRLYFNIMASFDQFERERIAERTREAFVIHRENGMRISGRLPYGYMVDPTRRKYLAPVPAEQEVVKIMRRMHRVNTSCQNIANWLDAHGHPTRDGKPWNRSSIRKILTRDAQLSRSRV